MGDVQTVSVGELRQNPTDALNRVSEGETIVVVKHNRPVADLVPHARRRGVSGAEVMAARRRFTFDSGMVADIAAARREPDRDYWTD